MKKDFKDLTIDEKKEYVFIEDPVITRIEDKE